MSALSQGTVHTVPTDLEVALRADPAVLALWERLTPLGRNEFICWVEDAKQLKTRERRIGRTTEELREGKGRPCCWPGCIHRTDKAPSRWQQAVLIDGKRLRDEARSPSEAPSTRRATGVRKSPLDEI